MRDCIIMKSSSLNASFSSHLLSWKWKWGTLYFMHSTQNNFKLTVIPWCQSIRLSNIHQNMELIRRTFTLITFPNVEILAGCYAVSSRLNQASGVLQYFMVHNSFKSPIITCHIQLPLQLDHNEVPKTPRSNSADRITYSSISQPHDSCHMLVMLSPLIKCSQITLCGVSLSLRLWSVI